MQPKQQVEPPVTVSTQPARSNRQRLSRLAGEGAEQRAKKRAKIAKDDVEIVGASHAEADITEPTESLALFMLDFEFPDGHVIIADDSLTDNPLLAMTLLKGLALPKVMENLPNGKANNIAELCLFLAKVYLITLFRISFRFSFPDANHLSYHRLGSVPIGPSTTWMPFLRPGGPSRGICR